MRRGALAAHLDHLLTDNDLVKISQLFSYISVRKELAELDLSRWSLDTKFKHRKPANGREPSPAGSDPSERLSCAPVYQLER